MHNKIIGVSGCARTGKDTFYNILKKYIPEVEQVALAFELKKDLKIVTRHDGENQDNVINMIEQVMKQMITKIENF